MLLVGCFLAQLAQTAAGLHLFSLFLRKKEKKKKTCNVVVACVKRLRCER